MVDTSSFDNLLTAECVSGYAQSNDPESVDQFLSLSLYYSPQALSTAFTGYSSGSPGSQSPYQGDSRVSRAQGEMNNVLNE